MRLWSIHPKYLDPMGMVALWREGLLAREVLKGKTKGFRSHPQLDRFKNHKSPIRAINTYLLYVWKEADRRGYNFNKKKIGKYFTNKKIKITKELVIDEFKILRKRLKVRCPKKYRELLNIKNPEVHPLFIIKKVR